MTTILSCVNLKGGVGKTALSVNFAAFCGMNGLKTLLIDLDPQTNATFSCMTVEQWQKHAAECGTVADLFGVRNHTSAEGRSREVEKVIKQGVFPGVDIIPSHLDLFTIDLDLASAPARERILKKTLKPILDSYDIIICDCPPNLTIPTQNAIAVSTHFVVPVSPDFLSSIGIALLVSRIDELWDSMDLEQKIKNVGIVLSRVGRHADHRDQMMNTLRARFDTQVFPTLIKERVAVSEAAAANRPVFEMNNEDASSEFTAVSEELLKRMELKK